MASLFEQVVDCCGLAPAFATRIITQACERSGVVAETMGPADLIRALPQIHQALGVFLEPQEVHLKVSAMRSLIRGSWPVFQAVQPPDDGAPGQGGPKTKSTS